MGTRRIFLSKSLAKVLRTHKSTYILKNNTLENKLRTITYATLQICSFIFRFDLPPLQQRVVGSKPSTEHLSFKEFKCKILFEFYHKLYDE